MNKQYPNIDENIFNKYLELAYIEQLEKNYRKLNYKTYKNREIVKGITADFVAENDKETIFYEIKTESNKKNDQINLIKNEINKLKNAKIKIVFLSKPDYKEIEIENIEMIIEQDMQIEGIPSELDVLSTHTFIDEIFDLTYSTIEIVPDNIKVTGDAMVSVDVQYGSYSDNSDSIGSFTHSFPFSFTLELSGSLEVLDSSYVYDTDSYYE